MTATNEVTPGEYIRQIERLVASGDDRGALAFSARYHHALAPKMTDTELLHVGGLLEGAAMAVDLASGDVPDRRNGVGEPARAAPVRDTASTR